MINYAIPELNPEAVVLAGMGSAIIGVSECGRLVYSVEEILRSLESAESMNRDEAEEWYQFNILPLMGLKGGFILLHPKTF